MAGTAASNGSSNGNGNGSVRIPADATEQLSFSGTLRRYIAKNGPGIWPDEYVSELADPLRRMQTFEEMRLSDGAVNTALATVEQLIYSSNWILTAPDDTPASTEILEFCEDNVYPLLEEMLRHLAGALQYGVGLFEPVYEWAESAPHLVVTKGKKGRTTSDVDVQPGGR
jgi:hypothetical protein